MAGNAVIGALRVDLGLDSAQFQSGLKKSMSSMDGFAARMASIGKVAAVSFAGIGLAAGALASKIVAASAVQQKAVAQLDAALKSTGGAVGLTSAGLQQLAADMQRLTTYGDESVIAAESLLLTFTKIGRDAFPQALKATLDVATAMGTDLKSAAVQVGKALNDPVAGISALSRSGIQFSESQKEVIKSLVETGQVAAAQNVILGELQTQFGGSAEAARNTLGGALEALGNAWGDLFEQSSGATEGLRQSVENLIEVISSPEFSSAITQFGGALVDAISVAATAFEKFVNGVFGFFEWANSQRSPEQLRSLANRDLKNKLEAGRFSAPDGAYDNMFAGSNTGKPLRITVPGLGTSGAAGVSSLANPLEDITSKFDDLADSAKSAGDAIANAVGGAIKGFISDMRSGKSAAEALANQLTNLADQALNMAIQLGIQAIVGGAFGAPMGAHIGVGSGGGSPINIAGGFGIPGRAVGGQVTGGSPYIVGERGPELFVPGQSGAIIPNNKMAGGNDHISVSVSVGVQNGNLVPMMVDVAGQVAGRVVRQTAPAAVATAQRNGAI